MPITLSLHEYLTLLNGGDDSLFAARQWILRNTRAIDWGRVITPAQARQVIALDPKEEQSHIEVYEDDAGEKIYVIFTRQGWFECDERPRLVKMRANSARNDFQLKNDCLELASYAARQLLAASYGGLDWKSLFFARVEVCEYKVPRFAAWLLRFNEEVVPQFKLFPPDFVMPPNQ